MNDLRCAIILNSDLPIGKAANAAAVISLTLGQRYPEFVGPELIDADGQSHPGLISVGIPVLAASNQQIGSLLSQCYESGFDSVLFPIEGQMTVDYAAFREAVRQISTAELHHSGLGIVGEKKALRKLTGKLKLFG
ncbi:DUF2000 domain-containing protein [Brenneria goodwinii]|uniref:DUF2000 domain-containing protein n=1 Tax=Brenneria goodwinii TaxID=1109412 RepID=A0A0G4JQW9_9GAMM|nr:DUF2000 domain-containing protein [Brenneria goodwinii]MCG8155406.1 DUF2000 domain-containing protein [Brenneria goodwinii]MCG8161606.1 DUF2000 domain-containing protein [Brenneria goodwinii]MCG8166047.1 DUF2000 domain-containing protein [Brenneria goodwinii]MCG8169253.1 DUF2000 domain-containing protein [Brenneria goodwinii]MCG8175743.1 DUF2000 domain-containing protein [Brenneria goodwinii]